MGIRLHADSSLPARLRFRVPGAAPLFGAWRGRPANLEHDEGELSRTGVVPFTSPQLLWQGDVTRRTTGTSDAPLVTTTIAGMDSTTGRSFPPDVQVAVGPTAIVEMVNEAVGIWTRGAGTPQRVSTESLGSFFSTTRDDRRADHVTDPRVLYDLLSGRFFALAFDVTRSETDVSFSMTGDPSGSWLTTALTASGCPDQPRLAVSTNLVVFADDLHANADCTGGFVGGETVVLDKQAMLNNTLSAGNVGFYGPDIRFSQITPAQPQSALNGMYMVSTDRGSSTVARLYTVTSPSDQSIPVRAVPISLLSPPPAAPQVGSPIALDVGDDRVSNAIWDGGNLWFTASDSCVATGETTPRACGRFVAISTSTNSVVEERKLVLDQGRSLLYPALYSDGSGNLLAVFGYSSPAEAAGLGVISKPSGGAFGSWRTLTAGTSGYARDVRGRNRWGDYFGAARDPSNPNVIWFAGEYANGPATWGTTIAAVTATAAAVPTVSYSAPSSTNVTSTSATLLANVNPQGSATTYWFEFGTTTGYGSATARQTLGASTSFQAVSAQASGLAPNTTYHFRLAATNAGGTAYGIDQTFTTPAARDTTPPRVQAVTSYAARGSVAHLQYRVWEDSGETREDINIVRSAGRIGSVHTGIGPITSGTEYYVRWKVPASVRGPLGFCVTSYDRAGNRSTESCAKLILR